MYISKQFVNSTMEAARDDTMKNVETTRPAAYDHLRRDDCFARDFKVRLREYRAGANDIDINAVTMDIICNAVNK